MREILFRGFRTDGKGWVYGHYILDPKGNSRIYCSPFEVDTSNTYYLVNQESVGQFTGFHDRNYNKIYEDDIVLLEYGTGKIVFCNGSFMIDFHEDVNMEFLAFIINKSRIEFREISQDVEVIGNVIHSI